MALLALVVVLIIFGAIVIGLTRPWTGRRRTPDTSFVSSETNDTSWQTTAAVIAIDAAHGHHAGRHHSSADSDGHAGESGWGEHGASSSWSESGDGGSD